MEMEEKSKEKTAFICHKGLYEFNVLPFGLVAAPGKFQHIMNTILAPLIGVCVYVYLDDIIVFSKNKDQHKKD